MRSFVSLPAILLLCCDASASADVAVLANRTQRSIACEFIDEESPARVESLPRGATRAFEVRRGTVIRFAAEGGSRGYELGPGEIYYFHDHGGEGPTELAQILLRHVEAPPIADAEQTEQNESEQNESKQREQAKSAVRASADGVLRLPVKILVDNGDRAAKRYWEPRLRKRVAEASRVFEQTCGLGFEVVAAEIWEQTSGANDFEAARDEFERRVDPAPAQLAIGFASQQHIASGQVHADGFRSPLGKHLLLREGSLFVSETERLELLVHELGHYLGAVHSPESNSVMRPSVADRRILARGFPLNFDPLNALAIATVAKELRERDVEHFGMLSVPARRRLRDVYATLGEALPNDPGGELALGQIADPTPIRADVIAPEADAAEADEPLAEHQDNAGKEAGAPAEVGLQEPPLVVATRAVLDAISARARQFQTATDAGEAAPSGADLLDGYVRAAAEVAVEQPADVRAQAFLLALAIGLDRSDALRKYAVMSDLVTSIEPNAKRDRRLAALGSPTIDQRHDLVQHFVLAAAIASSSGAKSAEAVALARQLHDARYGGGFSFAAWCADLAGIAFAHRVQDEPDRLSELARSFRVETVLPSLETLPEGLPMKEFKARYGSANDERFLRLDAEIRRRIAELPGAGKESK